MLKEIPVMEKEEKINMCQAMEEWYADAVREGMAKGIEDGRQIGRKIGLEEGRRQEKNAIIVKMLEGGMTVKEIKKFTGGTEAEIEQARLEAAAGKEL